MQIDSSLISRINEAHQEFVGLGKRNANGIVEQINKAREIGLYLLTAKEACKHGEWQSKFATAKGKSETDFAFDFDVRTGQNYIRVANLLPDSITTLPEGVRVLTDVFRMSSHLPEPGGHGAQQSHDPGFLVKSTKFVSSLLGCFGKWREKEPITQWPAKRRKDVKAQLEPVVAFYNEL